MSKTAHWTAAWLMTALSLGCGSSANEAPLGPATPAAGAAATAPQPAAAGVKAPAGAAGASVASSAGASAAAPAVAKPPIAEKCPKLPQVAGIVLNACCLSDNTCGVDGSTLGRGCLSGPEIKKYFGFSPPPASLCDGTPLAAAAAGAGGVGTAVSGVSAAGGGAAAGAAGAQTSSAGTGASAGSGAAGSGASGTAASSAGAGGR